MSKPQAGVITSNRRVQRHLTRSLASAGWEVHACAFDREQLALDLEQERRLYLLDGDEQLGDLHWALDTIGERHPRAKTLLLSPRASGSKGLELLSTAGLCNFVGRHGLDGTQDLIDEDELIVTCQKLISDDIFGLDKYLSTWGTQLHRVRIQSTDEKIAAIQALERFLARSDCHRDIRPLITRVSDELVINALFNAPRDPAGRPRYIDHDRRKPLAVEPQEAVDFCFACDGCHVGISVADSFGAISRQDLISNLERGHRRSHGMADASDAESDLGLYLIFNSITQLAVNLTPGERTEAIALFYVRGGHQAFNSSGRSFNIFSV